MKKLLFILVSLLFIQLGYAQVGINTTIPNAQLDIRSSNQLTPTNTDGILIPKVDAFPVINPTAAQQGMMVYLTTLSAGKQPGFYYWDNVTLNWVGLGGSSASAGWGLTGNAGTNSATNFIGTTDATDVVFRRENVISGKIGMANTSFGRNSLNPLSSGIYNSTFGLNSLINNTSGNSNSAFGNYALTNNTTGNSNTGFGSNVMYTNTTGINNTAVGSDALEYNSTGNNNSAIGYYSLYNNSIGNNNTAHGFEALRGNQTGGFNTAIGSRTLRASITGAVNTAIGDDALLNSNGADLNVAVGGSSMLENLTGSSNTAVGSGSLRNNVTASRNTAIGYEALYGNTGADNTALGFQSNISGTTGSRNITIGANSNVNDPAGNDQLSIANVIYGSDLNSTATGKIGIGVPIPTEKLEVAGKTKTTELQVTNGAVAGNVLTSDALGNATWQAPVGGSGTADHDFYEVGTTTPPDAITDNMFHTGNVGIGNNNPTYKLDVDETASGKIYALRVRHSNAIDGSITSGIQSSISGSFSTGFIQGVSTSITPGSGTAAIGLRNIVSGSSTADVYGVNNNISTSGSGSRTGVNNSFPGTGTGITFGMYNSFSNPNAISLGVKSIFTASGIRDKTGVENEISNSTGGFHTGIKNTFTNNNGAMEETGVFSDFTGSSEGNIRGIYNKITNSGDTNIHYGLYNNINGSGGLKRYGVENILSGTSTSEEYGVENNISTSGGNRTHYGVRNYLTGTGTGFRIGTDNWISGSGSGDQYGVNNYIDNSGIGTKYGVYNYIPPATNGLHYGVYSNATKANSYAGYFLGRFSIGTTTANNYILPLSRGTVSQIMQTDATGNVTWVSPSTIASGTLDQAYDFGGAGLGRTITADAGAVTINGNDGLVSTGTYGSGAIVLSGTGTRMVWNPRKAVFRVGYVDGTEWDDSNLGNISTAFGRSTKASGYASTAFGSNTTASESYTTVFGQNTIASGDTSTAFGRNTTASGRTSTAFGQENSAPSYGETVLGIGATAYTTSVNGAAGFRPANATDRLFVIGNAIDTNANDIVDAGERSNAMVVIKNGNTGIGADPLASHKLYTFNRQLTAIGDGQSTIYGYRTRDSRNDGADYSNDGANSGVSGYNIWGDSYTFGVMGHCDNDFARSGGVLGSNKGGNYWGSLGYNSSSSATYGVYATAALATGTGRMSQSSSQSSIGGGFYGGMIGSWSKGGIGNINSGTLFASYNSGDEYTSGKQIEIVSTTTGKKAAYTVTSTESIIYKKGKITLINGIAQVTFDKDYVVLLGDIPVITTTPMGQCNGIYIESVNKNGFVIKELNNGTSNVTVSWIAVGDRIDADNSIQRDVLADDFDSNINEVMFNENNKQDKAKAVWSDGNKINFGKLPENLIEKSIKKD